MSINLEIQNQSPNSFLIIQFNTKEVYQENYSEGDCQALGQAGYLKPQALSSAVFCSDSLGVTRDIAEVFVGHFNIRQI